MALQSLKSTTEKWKTGKVALLSRGVLSLGCWTASGSLRASWEISGKAREANSLASNEATAALNPTEQSSLMSLFSIKAHYFRSKNIMVLSVTFLPAGEVRYPSVQHLHTTKSKMENGMAIGGKARTLHSLLQHPPTHTHITESWVWGSVLENMVSPWRSISLCYTPWLWSHLKEWEALTSLWK